MKITINANEKIKKKLIHAILVLKIINIKVTVFFKNKIMIFLNYNFLLKLKKIQKNSKITSPLIHGGQWTATLKPN